MGQSSSRQSVPSKWFADAVASEECSLTFSRRYVSAETVPVSKLLSCMHQITASCLLSLAAQGPYRRATISTTDPRPAFNSEKCLVCSNSCI
jgi:hypothetical protein